MTALRLVSYLAPSLPAGLFEAVAAHVERATGRRVTLRFETKTSGPPPDEPDPFSAGEADVGFLCSPGYLWLSALETAPVELVPAAFVFDDPRGRGRPVYFSDVIVRAGSRVRSFADLRGGSWAYNDVCSLSGYFSLLRRLDELGAPDFFFETVRASGSHLQSIRAVASGAADAAAVDSNVLAMRFREEPALSGEIRVLESWGPFPIQPVVVHAGLANDVKQGIAQALLGAREDAEARAQLARFGVAGFAPVSSAFYEMEREALKACVARVAGRVARATDHPLGRWLRV